MSKPYCMSKYINMKDLVSDVMIATDLTEVERMCYIWSSLTNEQQEKIKEISSNMYYCILYVMDEYKTNKNKE